VLPVSNACFNNISQANVEGSKAIKLVRALPHEPNVGEYNTFVLSVIILHPLLKALYVVA
jgi:hypothetical protein